MDVRLPNGLVLRNVPKGTSKDDILKKLKAKGYDVDELLKPPSLEEEEFAPTKKEGVLAAAEKGARSLISSGRTAVEALLGDEEAAAQRGLERSRELGERFEEGPSLERIKRIYEEQGLLPAAGQAISDIPEAIAQQLPNLATTAAGARLGAMAGAPLGPVGAGAGAVLGAVAPSVLQQLGAGVERQAAEGATDINLGRAIPAALGGGALETLAQAIPLGKQGLRVILGETGEKLFKAGATDDLEKLASEGLAKTLAKGTATGIVAEVPTEITQQMLERWQAGLDLTSPDALKEYGEVAYQAGLLGPIGAVGRVAERAGARGELEAREDAAEATVSPVEPSMPIQAVPPFEGEVAAARPEPEAPVAPAMASVPEAEPTQLEPPIQPPVAVEPVTPPEEPQLFTPPTEAPKIDPLLPRAIEVVQTLNRAGITTLQRNLGIGYTRAKKLIGILENQGIVSAPGTDGLRKVLQKPEPAEPEGVAPSEPPSIGRVTGPATPTDIGATGAGIRVPVQRGVPVEPGVERPTAPAVGAPVEPTAPATGRKETKQPPLNQDLFPRVDAIQGRAAFGLGVIKFDNNRKVLAENKPLYRETNASGADGLLREDSLGQFWPTTTYVTDDPVLAIGQGINRGVMVKFRPNSLSGVENVKPGTGVIGGREYVTDLVAPRAIEQITFKDPKQVNNLRVLSRKNLSNNFNRVNNPDGSVTYTRKELAAKVEETAPDRLPPVGVGPIPKIRDQFGDPLPREANIIEQGVRGKSVHEVAKFIADTASHPAERAIARRVGEQLRRIEDAGLSTFKFKLIDTPSEYLFEDSGLKRARSRGTNVIKRGLGDKKLENITYIRSSNYKQGLSGASYRTVLHELVHAVTSPAIEFGKDADPNSKLYKDVKELSKIFKVIKSEVRKLKRAQQAGQPLTKFQYHVVNKYNNAVQNEHEILAWGLTDADMQAWLETIPYEGNRSLWSKFVEKIRDLLGLPAGTESALSEILRSADKLLDSDVREISANVDKYFGQATRRGQVQEIRSEQTESVNEPGTIVNNFPRFDERLGDRVSNALSRVSPGLRKGALGFMTMNQLGEVYGKFIPSIRSLEKIMNARAAKLMKRREQMDKNLLGWYKTAQSAKYKKLLPKFFDIANESTRLQVVFDKTDPEYDAANPLTKQFEALPDALQKMYFEILNDYKKKSDEFINLLSKSMTPSEMNKLRAAYEYKRLKVYLPLFRQGEYWVTYQDKNNETVTIAVETENEQRRLAEWARKNTIDPNSIRVYSRMSQPDWRQMPPSGFVGDVVKTLSGKGIDDKTLNSIYELFLNYLPSESIRQNFRPRQNVLGFEPDVLQVYANMASRMSNQLTNMEYALDIEKTVQDIRSEVGDKSSKDLLDVLNTIEGQVDFMRDPKNANWASKLSYFSYVFYIAGNVSSAMINLTQMPMVVYPLLGGKYGMGRALSAMNAAKTKYFQGGWDDNNQFMPDWTFGKGKNVSPEYRELYERAVEQGAIRRSSGYEIAEARKVRTEDFVGLRARVEHGLGYFFQNSERMNREITLLAAYDLARKDGAAHEAAIDQAMQLVNDAHGASLAETGPRFFQNDIGKVIFTFKRFAQSQIYLLAKLFNNTFRDEDPKVRAMARNQLLGISFMSYLFAGVQGMPMYGAAALLASLTQNDDDEPFDFDAEVRKLIGDLGYKGPVNQLFAVDIASRTGFNGLLWKDDPQRLSEIGPFYYAVERVAGPTFSAFMGFGRAYEQFQQGYYDRGLESMTPSFIRNGLKALRIGTEDARTKDGVPIVEDISKYNVFMQVLGFNPAELAESRARTGAMKTAEKKILARRAALFDKLDLARVNGDFDGAQDVMSEIMAFNQKNPAVAITSQGIATSFRERRRRERESVEGVSLSPRLRQQLMDKYGGY